MIVPRTRLIVLTAAVLLPETLAAAWRPELGVQAAAASVALVLAAALDAMSGRGKLRDLAVQVPEIVRLTVDRWSGIKVLIRKPPSMKSPLRVGLALPRAMASKYKDVSIRLDADSDCAALNWPCRALRRGRFTLQRCHLETGSRLGLWNVRKTLEIRSEIRAYPDLVSGQQHLRGLFQRRQWGLRTQRRVGKGREFEQLRDYLPGDSFEDIEWKATARRRHPVTKVYQVEQAQEIYVLLDASRLSTRNAAFIIQRRYRTRSEETLLQATIFERYIIAALVMALASDRLGDRFGLLAFGDKPECFIKAGRGRAHYNACRDALYNRMPRAVSPDFDELFTFIGTHLRKRALLVFLTSLDDPMLSESFVHAMQGACRQHIVMVNMFRPPGAYPLFSSPDVRSVEGIHQHLVGHILWSSINETRRVLHQHGADLHLLDKDRLCSQLVSRYMEVKQRQLL